jgi:cell division protease FtsH
MVGSFGMAGSLISYEAISQGAISQTNLVAKVLGDGDGKQRVEDILEAQRARVREVLEENRDVHAALRDALIERDELVRDEISEVIEKALANRN